MLVNTKNTYNSLKTFKFKNYWFTDHGNNRSPQDGPELVEHRSFVRRFFNFPSCRFIFWWTHSCASGRDGYFVGFDNFKNTVTGLGNFVSIANNISPFLGFDLFARLRCQSVNVKFGRVIIGWARETQVGEKGRPSYPRPLREFGQKAKKLLTTVDGSYRWLICPTVQKFSKSANKKAIQS